MGPKTHKSVPGELSFCRWCKRIKIKAVKALQFFTYKAPGPSFSSNMSFCRILHITEPSQTHDDISIIHPERKSHGDCILFCFLNSFCFRIRVTHMSWTKLPATNRTRSDLLRQISTLKKGCFCFTYIHSTLGRADRLLEFWTSYIAFSMI